MNTEKMTQKEFDALLNYSCSNPTRLSIGKRWKRAKYYYNQTKNAKDWWLCEIFPHQKDPENYVTIKQSRIEILTVDEELIRNRLYS